MHLNKSGTTLELVMVSLDNVRPGSRNGDVRILQKALIAQGHLIPEGEQTRAAYRTEQVAQGYRRADTDGIPGYASLSALGAGAGFTAAPTGPPWSCW